MIGRVLVFGDSIGQGFYDENDGGWVRLLQRDFFKESRAGKRDVNIINLSVSGHTSQEVVKRIKQESEVRSNDERILTIIAIGVNDSYEKKGVRRTSKSEFANNMKKMIEIAKTFGNVMILGLTSCVESRVKPTRWNGELIYTNELIKQYDAIVKDEAQRANVVFVPLWQKTYNAQALIETMPDGIHPNAAGHEVIYNEVKKKLNEIL